MGQRYKRQPVVCVTIRYQQNMRLRLAFCARLGMSSVGDFDGHVGLGHWQEQRQPAGHRSVVYVLTRNEEHGIRRFSHSANPLPTLCCETLGVAPSDGWLAVPCVLLDGFWLLRFGEDRSGIDFLQGLFAGCRSPR